MPLKRSVRPGRIVYWVLVGIFGVCLVGTLVTTHLTMVADTSDASSMAPSISNGALITYVRWSSPRRGDLVVVKPPGTTNGIDYRRVIGLPGDHVACCTAGKVTVNGKALDETEYLSPGSVPSQAPFSFTLKPGQYWVMVDDREGGFPDSRQWGPLPAADIVGRIFVVAGQRSGPVKTPQAFVATGLAPADHRNTYWLFAFAPLFDAFCIVLLIVLAVFGIIRTAIRRNRARRQATSPPPPVASM